MKTTDIDIESAIEAILALGEQPAATEPAAPKKRGRKPTRHNIPIWSLSFYEPRRNRTFALISMCIKDNFAQSIQQLALSLSAYKSRPVKECLEKLRELSACGLLGYYDDNRNFRRWNGKGDVYGLESMCD